jgi:hypothetical protein
LRHLRKFNESVDNKDEMIEYIKLCFIEFYDKGDDVVFTEEFNDGESVTFEMTIDEPEITSGDYSSDINVFVKNSEEIAEFYKEVENCLEKVVIRYNLKTTFEYQFPPEGYIRIIFVLEGTIENEDNGV